jgi:hypothetical protein
MLLQPLDCFLMSWFLSRGFRLFTSALVNSETTPSWSASKGGRGSLGDTSAKKSRELETVLTMVINGTAAS